MCVFAGTIAPTPGCCLCRRWRAARFELRGLWLIGGSDFRLRHGRRRPGDGMADKIMKLLAGCRILVVEDEATIAANLLDYLQLQGAVVDAAHDGIAARGRLGSTTYDVVLLDLGLPRIDGLSVLHHLRHQLHLATPVLILTARDALPEKLDSFNAGADDYLTKPFALAEVAARVAALHRRARGDVVADVRCAGSLSLDRRTRVVRVGDTPVHLMPRSMQILDVLLQDPGRVVLRSELEALLWPDEIPGADALRSQIHLLRRALQQVGYVGLETVHGVGYRVQCE
jgi:DNA-binding response OmpR family regulator